MRHRHLSLLQATTARHKQAEAERAARIHKRNTLFNHTIDVRGTSLGCFR